MVPAMTEPTMMSFSTMMPTAPLEAMTLVAVMFPSAMMSIDPSVVSMLSSVRSPKPLNTISPESDTASTSLPSANSSFSSASLTLPARTSPPISSVAVKVTVSPAIKSATSSSSKSLIEPPAMMSIVVPASTRPTNTSPSAITSIAPTVAWTSSRVISPRPRNAISPELDTASTTLPSANSSFPSGSLVVPARTSPPISSVALSEMTPLSAVKSAN